MIGDHVYVLAPVAVNVTCDPIHTDWSTPAFTVGAALTVTATWSVFVQPAADVPMTVYVAVADGAKATPLVAAGDHEYVAAPDAVNVIV
jgi:hypothetical protein